ncbi:Zn-ribbon domain-containing OB-fold protein [Delftia tsuruhatensis]|uniref:Zn-ribbon domain-containing OB-fold protein n=1 Tax=Delftia tsuruhatensis TaxID=180282 RepID=UPI003A89BABB
MHLSAQTHYQAELDAGRFCIQQCPQCTRHVFTPRELCPHCGASPLRWVRASGQGTVYSTSTVARKSDAGGDYNVALIDLDEGVRMMGRVEGIAPADVRIGQRVSAHMASKDGRGLVLFQPALQPAPQASRGGAA